MGHRTKTQCGRDVVRRKWQALPFDEGIIACELWAQTLQTWVETGAALAISLQRG